MGRRGPKSSEEKRAAVAAVLPERPGPPGGRLNDAGVARWWEIVNELPVHRFRASDHNMLSDLIITEQLVAQCNENISINGPLMGPGVVENPAVRMRASHLRTIVQLQRALRLCPSMRKRQDDSELGKGAPATDAGKTKTNLWD